MIDELNRALSDYQTKWQTLVAERTDKQFFEALRPVAVGWKVGDKTEYDQKYAELHDQCDRIIETWMNGRWIAKMHLRTATLPNGITLIKLMQRRPDSDDATGLDHVDFYNPAIKGAEAILQKEPNLKWTAEVTRLSRIANGYQSGSVAPKPNSKRARLLISSLPN